MVPRIDFTDAAATEHGRRTRQRSEVGAGHRADVQDLQVALKRSARLEAELEALDDAIGEQVSALDYFTNS